MPPLPELNTETVIERELGQITHRQGILAETLRLLRKPMNGKPDPVKAKPAPAKRATTAKRGILPRKKHGQRTGLTDAILDYVKTRGTEGAGVTAIANAVGRRTPSISSTMTRLTKRNQLKRVNGVYTVVGT